MRVEIAESGTKGSAFIKIDGQIAAEMTYSIASPELIIIDHTEVADVLRGKNAGKQLLTALVEKARKENIKIIPLCPFAHRMFQKDESLRDVLKSR